MPGNRYSFVCHENGRISIQQNGGRHRYSLPTLIFGFIKRGKTGTIVTHTTSRCSAHEMRITMPCSFPSKLRFCRYIRDRSLSSESKGLIVTIRLRTVCIFLSFRTRKWVLPCDHGLRFQSGHQQHACVRKSTFTKQPQIIRLAGLRTPVRRVSYRARCPSWTATRV